MKCSCDSGLPIHNPGWENQCKCCRAIYLYSEAYNGFKNGVCRRCQKKHSEDLKK